MKRNKIIKRVLLEWGAHYLLLAVGFLLLLLLISNPEYRDNNYAPYIWKHEYVKTLGIPVFLLAFVGNLRSLICIILDLGTLQTRNKCIVLEEHEKNQQLLYTNENPSEILWEKPRNRIVDFIRGLGYVAFHLTMPIRVDRRIVDSDYVQGHTYQVKILRFSHLLLEIEEVEDSNAIEDALLYAEADVSASQEQINLYQEELHAQQKKYAIQLQKYEAAPDEQKKDVHYWMMHDIEVRMDGLRQQIKEEEIRLKEYQKKKQNLEDKRDFQNHTGENHGK